MPALNANRQQILIGRLFWSLVTVDCLLAAILGNYVSTDSDAAGNGMANGFATLLEIAAFILLGLLGLIFIFVRAVAVRYFLILLVTALFVLLAILALFQFTG